MACFSGDTSGLICVKRKENGSWVGMPRGSSLRAPQNNVLLHTAHMEYHTSASRRTRGCRKQGGLFQVPSRPLVTDKKSNWKRYLLRTTLDSINGSVNPILEPCESLFHRPRQISTTNWMSSVHFKWRLACPILCKNLLHIDVRLREDNAWVSLSSGTYHTFDWTLLDGHSVLAPISSSGSEYARLQVDS